ncbi:MAG: SUMF1/EgtB/PvdO family nonheme iron enzyme [Saprospiraceae bacterium]|nr:SUMF1/EgtB/PvdO family nonheme iron enzyme [Saprospiraceae bacterium]
MNRGGSWNNNPQNCRVANRNNNSPDNRNNNIGFRLANAVTRPMMFVYGQTSCARNRPARSPAPDTPGLSWRTARRPAGLVGSSRNAGGAFSFPLCFFNTLRYIQTDICCSIGVKLL